MGKKTDRRCNRVAATAGSRAPRQCLLIAFLALSEIALSQTQGAAWGAPKQPSDPIRSDARSNAVRVDEAFVIGTEDVLGIDVWKEPEVSRTVTVRSDGKLSLPLIGEMRAEGKTPKELQEEIRTKLSEFISFPEVTLIVQEVRSHRFNVLGQVLHPGSYVLTSSTTVLDAIALAGGFRDFAKQKAIYILRSNSDGTQRRLAFNYREVIKGDPRRQNIALANHDTVVVP